ncbi:hypothetical protein ACOMHN_019685 [Nucella lapillus]
MYEGAADRCVWSVANWGDEHHGKQKEEEETLFSWDDMLKEIELLQFELLSLTAPPIHHDGSCGSIHPSLSRTTEQPSHQMNTPQLYTALQRPSARVVFDRMTPRRCYNDGCTHAGVIMTVVHLHGIQPERGKQTKPVRKMMSPEIGSSPPEQSAVIGITELKLDPDSPSLVRTSCLLVL